MKIFISIKSYKNGSNTNIINLIKDAVKKSGNVSYSFIDEGYISDKKEMMKLAFKKMDECDMIICEISKCAFGVGVEAGYFYANKKKIVVCQDSKSEKSSAMQGLTDHFFRYNDSNDLKNKLIKTLK